MCEGSVSWRYSKEEKKEEKEEYEVRTEATEDWGAAKIDVLVVLRATVGEGKREAPTRFTSNDLDGRELKSCHLGHVLGSCTFGARPDRAPSAAAGSSGAVPATRARLAGTGIYMGGDEGTRASGHPSSTSTSTSTSGGSGQLLSCPALPCAVGAPSAAHLPRHDTVRAIHAIHRCWGRARDGRMTDTWQRQQQTLDPVPKDSGAGPEGRVLEGMQC
ncbi:hypothetical protein BBK36DRAFT_1188325 [Trichoderma citrinoviride]|uniref:Uncharacterized protein n=1 Tax=Trichoderma citrinoviride TaxID=58853 RepID=A0A2T4BKA6_9HYPO|nr:hypothetical protein BBK36DRAFT_1188325 [Trichoderma citrinoviride]PTB69745.1 hypothetical protein BBK36DRAFT_1188325 [Trichoderma citrinoviride]